MSARRNRMIVAAAAGAALLSVSAAAPAQAGPRSTARPLGRHCSAGARTLSHLGDHVYPDTGNGGYRSVHTDVDLVYDAATNTFLPGNHVVLTDRATQCLSSFSLDFARTSAAGTAGPDMAVRKVLVDGRRATFRFVRPTYPGDPKGPDDPDPRAHQAGQNARVGGPQHNPLPPACSPQLTSQHADAQDGQPCAANKLVITPARPLRNGALFAVTVFYTGRPGVAQDGDGTTEGWFRSDTPRGDGGFVTTEPVGSEDWMPLNDHPSAKPTYDFYDTVAKGKTVLCNGILESRTPHPATSAFPQGSVTWHWHAAEPIASYLVEDSIGDYSLRVRTAANGVRYYEAQADGITAKQRAANYTIMDEQQDVTEFESQFNGAYPFPSAGVVVGLPQAGFDEEMETMITFAGGTIDLDTLYHENMHQWWGDNVTESNYNMTYYKEGLATFGEFLFAAREAQTAAGGPYTSAGKAAFERSLVAQFDRDYATSTLWSGAPSDPTPYTLFDGNSTYERPGDSYIALRQILGADNFTRALQAIQRRYGGATIDERQLEAAFAHWLPSRTPDCTAELHEFFTQWWDTPYPAGRSAKPSITGPGLAGSGFHGAHGRCG